MTSAVLLHGIAVLMIWQQTASEEECLATLLTRWALNTQDQIALAHAIENQTLLQLTLHNLAQHDQEARKAVLMWRGLQVQLGTEEGLQMQ